MFRLVLLALLGAVHGTWLGPVRMGSARRFSGIMRMQESWGGQHAAEAEAAVAVVQKAMQLCLALACDMGSHIDP